MKLTDIVLIFSTVSPSVNQTVYKGIHTVEGLSSIVVNLAGDIETTEYKVEAMHGSGEKSDLFR